MMEGSVPRPPHNGCEEGADKPMEKDPAAAKGKSVVVLKGNDVTIRNGIVFMPNTIEMAQLKRPEKGQFKTKVQFSSMMTELDVSRLLVDTFPILKDQRFYCAAAADNRTRLDFHGQPRIWDGQFLKRKIKGNSALYIFTDKGESSSSSDTGFCDQEMDTSSNVVQNPDIYPKSSGMEGGEKFLISFTELLTPEVTSGGAKFEGVGIARLEKVNPCGLAGIVPRSTKPGVVDVKVFDETGNCLGTTTFCYRGPWETLEQAVCSENLSMLFTMLAQKFQPSEVSVGDNDAAQSQTQQQQSLQLLQLLVYTAAETGAQEFLKIIFSTSAGRTVFYSYKDKTPLPEDVARANGHTYLAQYLQDVNTRLSKEVGSEAQSIAIDWLELVKAVQTQASAAQVKSVKEEKHPSESGDNSSDYFADSETSSNGSLGLDEANQPDSDSDSSIDKELCNIAGWYNEEPNKRPATCARQEGPSCETPEVEKPPNREDSEATRLDNKDRTPFEKEKPAADSKKEKDYAVGWGLINSLSQWLSTTRKKKKKDETKSATIRRFNGATFFWGPFDKGDTSGQANVHSAENPQECTEKGHLSSQRRTAPSVKYSLIIMACVVLVVLVEIMQGIVSSRLSPPKDSPPPALESPFSVYENEALLSMREWLIGFTIVVLVWLINTECAGKSHLSSQRRTAPDVKYSRIIMTCVVMTLMAVLPVLTGIMQRIVWVIGFTIVALVWLYQVLINTGKRKRDESIMAIGKSEKERVPRRQQLHQNHWEKNKNKAENFCRTLEDPLEHNE